MLRQDPSVEQAEAHVSQRVCGAISRDIKVSMIHPLHVGCMAFPQASEITRVRGLAKSTTKTKFVCRKVEAPHGIITKASFC